MQENETADPIEALGAELAQAVAAANDARERLYARIRQALDEGESENGLARRSGVDRMTIRKLAGKRP
jgi:hypothetical protein